MPAFVNNKLAAIADLRPDVISPLGQICKSRQAVALSDGFGEPLEPIDVLGRLAAELVEKLLF